MTAVDPFGYYAEGIQQHLDDAFASAHKGSSDEAVTPPGNTPSAKAALEASERDTPTAEAAAGDPGNIQVCARLIYCA